MSIQSNKKALKGIILYSRDRHELHPKKDYSVIRLLEVAEKTNIELNIVKPNDIELIVTRDDRKSILVNDKVTQLPDFVIPRMGSSTTYYGLAVIRQLEHLGVYVCNGAKVIETVKDKLHMHQILAHSKLPTPKTMLAKFPVETSVVKREIGFPCVIKNISGAQGTGIFLCRTEDDFNDIMELIYSNNNKANLIIQEFIERSQGKDLRVFVLGGRVLGCMQRVSTGGFKANFSKGAQVNAFELTPEIEWLATETARLVDLDIAGIDLLFDGDSFKICEANSSPGFNGLEQVIGKHVAEDILEYIRLKVGI